MDRVVQWHEGLLFLDFNPQVEVPGSYYAEPSLQRFGRYHITRLDHLVNHIPPLVLYYSNALGSESGHAHSSVRQRFDSGDPEIQAGMQALARKADDGLRALEENNKLKFARLMLENFELRLSLYGTERVGEKNLDAIRKLEAAGYGGKFPGSGGAIVAGPLLEKYLPPPDIYGYEKTIPRFYIPITPPAY